MNRVLHYAVVWEHEAGMPCCPSRKGEGKGREGARHGRNIHAGSNPFAIVVTLFLLSHPHHLLDAYPVKAQVVWFGSGESE